ncbi:MAG: holo-ACP synthase [Actinomycetota bacterium]|nr:holo-ACP synthase [Actinomycetota bacterium]
MNRDERVVDAVSDLTATVGVSAVAAIGIDAVDISEFERDMEIGGRGFLTQAFSAAEIEHCDGDVEKLAARFALKEAALKVLGTGIRGIGLHDVEVHTAPSGQPELRLSPGARDIAASQTLGPLRCSATHEAGLALAVVVAPDRAVTSLEDK